MENPPRKKTKLAIAVLALGLTATCLLWNLACYALWDDEAGTALGAKAVLREGDTSAWVGNGNILAFYNGVELVDLRIRSHPPLPIYITAGSLAMFGLSNWAGRLPFALCGLAAAALLLWWGRKERLQFFVALAAGIIGSVSFCLYSRNCRYYALAILLAEAVAWFYWHCRGQKRHLLGFALCSSLLFATHYSAYVTVHAAILADYLLWRRREMTLTAHGWLIVGIPQIIINGCVAAVWNPLRTGFADMRQSNGITDRLQMFWWHLRDLNALEFLSWPLVLAALVAGVVLWLLKKQPLPANALRACGAVLASVAAVVATTSQVRAATSVADMRYLVCVLPLCIALTAWAACRLSCGRWWLLAPLLVTVFFTNITHGGMFFKWCGMRSTWLCFAGELLHPANADPFTPTASWLRKNAAAGATIHAVPGNTLYSLMFHAPHVLYAWQFDDRAKPQVKDLPPVHFKGEIMPDYLIAFGPYVSLLQRDIVKYGHKGTNYILTAKIDNYWQPLYRPELFWRTFKPIARYNKDRDVVFIFKRVGDPGN